MNFEYEMFTNQMNLFIERQIFCPISTITLAIPAHC